MLRIALLLAFATSVFAQTGTFLIASDSTRDADFAQTIILILSSSDRGTAGLILNQRTSVPVLTLFPGWKPATANIYKGGPMRMGINGLLRSRTKIEHASHVFGDVYLVSDKAVLKSLAGSGTPLTSLHVFVGLCGWSAGQLRDELQRGVWTMRPADAAVVFDPDPGSVWARTVHPTRR